jgi:hypothetical protein
MHVIPRGFDDTEFPSSNQLWMLEPVGAVSPFAARPRKYRK